MDRKYFDEIYRSDPDPWRFESSRYEQRKYALTMASLPDRRYRSAFEPGCSVGVLSALLAERCDSLLATDIVPGAVERARLRCIRMPGVRIEERAIPEDWPVGPFDLVILSEIGYYFDRPTLKRLVSAVLHTTSHGAKVVGVHWRGATNYPLSGDEVHQLIDNREELEGVVHHVESAFILDVWSRGPRRTRGTPAAS